MGPKTSATEPPLLVVSVQGKDGAEDQRNGAASPSCVFAMVKHETHTTHVASASAHASPMHHHPRRARLVPIAHNSQGRCW